VGQERLGPSYFFTSLVLGPLNSLVWWEVPLGYIALRSFLFLQKQIQDIIIIAPAACWGHRLFVHAVARLQYALIQPGSERAVEEIRQVNVAFPRSRPAPLRGQHARKAL
jgi:hypothetical protein